MPDRPKGKGQTKCSPWSSRLEVGHRANNTTLEKCTVMKLPESKISDNPWCTEDGKQTMEEVMAEAKTHTGL
jgi:hypothetical protein